jgi:hypothetical protein
MIEKDTMNDGEMFSVLMRAGWIILGSGFKNADDTLKKLVNAELSKSRSERIHFITHSIDSLDNNQIFYIFYKNIQIIDISKLGNRDELIFDAAKLKEKQAIEDAVKGLI